MYVIGENPKLSDPDWNHLNHALKELDFLVVQELFLSETAQVADVVFSAASVAEKEGTVTNTERRCMRIHQAIEPIGNTLADWEIICRLSTAMGYEMRYERSGRNIQRDGIPDTQKLCRHDIRAPGFGRSAVALSGQRSPGNALFAQGAIYPGERKISCR